MRRMCNLKSAIKKCNTSVEFCLRFINTKIYKVYSFAKTKTLMEDKPLISYYKIYHVHFWQASKVVIPSPYKSKVSSLNHGARCPHPLVV